jgi:hypothetical protein
LQIKNVKLTFIFKVLVEILAGKFIILGAVIKTGNNDGRREN